MVNLNRKFFFFIAILAALASSAVNAKTKKSHKKIKITQQAPLTWTISSSYFLQISLNEENCLNTITEECLFRDKFLTTPYFHDTTVTIFLDKAFATQLSDPTGSRLITLKDGFHKLRTTNNNLISFNVKNGDIFDLKLLVGDLKNEREEHSKCVTTKILYNFYNIYDRLNELEISSGIYKDEYDFDGIKDYIVFAKKTNPFDLMAVSRSPDGKNSAFNSTRLCKAVNHSISNVRNVTKEECSLAENFNNEECYHYASCVDHLVVNECEVVVFLEDGDI